MNNRSLLHPAMNESATLLLAAFPGTITSTWRSYNEQRALRRNYERGRSKFPAEQPGNSTHHTGLAFDFVTRRPELQREAGRWWTRYGGRWSSTDWIHFEHPYARAALREGLTSRRWWR